MKIKMLCNVRPDIPFLAKPGTIWPEDNFCSYGERKDDQDE